MEHNLTHAQVVARLIKSGAQILNELNTMDVKLMHATFGISGEAGELLDAVKKAIIYRKPIDRANIIEELGDLEFYLEDLRQTLGITREQTIEANIDKLAVRYANFEYADIRAQERADKQPTGVAQIPQADQVVTQNEPGGLATPGAPTVPAIGRAEVPVIAVEHPEKGIVGYVRGPLGDGDTIRLESAWVQ